MKTFIIVQSREVGNYESIKIKLKNPNIIIPREKERITVNNGNYDVISVYYDYDKGEILITVI